MSQQSKRNANDVRTDISAVVDSVENISSYASEIKDPELQTKLKTVRESAYAARDYLNLKLGKNSG